MHASTKCTPSEVMYGWKAKLPMDIKPSEDDTVDPKPLSDDASPDVLETLTNIHKQLYLTISSSIHSARDHQKHTIDR